MEFRDYMFLAFISIVIIVHYSTGRDQVIKEINHLKQSQERFDALIKDSIKMHTIYENWELNYNELKRLEE